MERPNSTFDLKIGEEVRTIKMSYGLFNEIMTVIPNPENIGDLLITDAGLRDYIVRRILTGNKKITTDEDLVDAFELDIDMDDLSDLVTWVGDHVLYFFMTSAAKTQKLGQKYVEVIQGLVQSNQSKNGVES